MLLLAGLPLYFENPIGRLYEQPDGYVVVDYNPGVRGEYRAFLRHLENALKRHSRNKMLANRRALEPFTGEERTWIREQWLTVSHALQRETVAAVLLLNNVFARLGSSPPQEARGGALVYRLFNDAETAAAWLRQLA